MKKNVLVVEDDQLLAEVYRHVLQNDGFKVEIANDYQTALSKFKAKRISIVVLDIILGGKNGFEVLKAFRMQPGGREVPIVIITGMNTQDLDMDKELMVSLNILGVHTKSQFSIKEFSNLISNYINLYERT